MDTKDGRHFEVWPDGSSSISAEDSQEDAPKTQRGLGIEHQHNNHQALGDDSTTKEQAFELSQITREGIEHAPTQEVRMGDVLLDNSKPSFDPKHVKSVHPTEQFFLTGRIHADTNDIPTSRRGRIQANTFLGLGHDFSDDQSSTLPTSQENDELDAKLSAVEHDSDGWVMGHARRALLRTMNFLDYLILQSPRASRASLKSRKENLVIPKHLPEEDEIRRFEYYAQSFGYYGPVLWFIPSGIWFADLVDADILSEDWWHDEPNFPEGFQSYSPFDMPVGQPNYREPGYWVLAIPGLTPGTTGKKFDEDSLCFTDFIRMSGLDVLEGSLHPKHRMMMKVLTVPNVLVFCAIAQHSKELISHIPLIARTATIIKTAKKEVKDLKSGKIITVTERSIHSRCRACVQFAPDKKLHITDWVDDAPSQAVGMIIFIIPHVYD